MHCGIKFSWIEIQFKNNWIRNEILNNVLALSFSRVHDHMVENPPNFPTRRSFSKGILPQSTHFITKLLDDYENLPPIA